VNIQPNPSGTYGNQVVIDHGNGVFTQSAHLGSTSVKPNDTVTAGQEVGTAGRTGNTPKSGDTHLHFEVRIGSPAPVAAGGKVVDPMKALPQPPPQPSAETKQ
jgi:murein DD-endopeptidase MepM/ murein hydrolase activator NlpD